MYVFYIHLQILGFGSIGDKVIQCFHVTIRLTLSDFHLLPLAVCKSRRGQLIPSVGELGLTGCCVLMYGLLV